jgi:hypothetical protein
MQPIEYFIVRYVVLQLLEVLHVMINTENFLDIDGSVQKIDFVIEQDISISIRRGS